MNPAQEDLHKNIRRTVGIVALRKLRTLIEADLTEDATRAGLLRGILRFGWIVLLLGLGLLAHYLGVI